MSNKNVTKNNSKITNISHPTEHILSFKKFLLLNIVTFGVYNVYWGWKYWEIIKRVEGSQIHSGVRGFFITLTSFSLFGKVLRMAKEQGYKENYNPLLLAWGFFIVTFINNRFDHPDLIIYLLVSIGLSIFTVLIAFRVVSAMNFYLTHTKEDVTKFAIKPNYTLITILITSVLIFFVIGFFAEA